MVFWLLKCLSWFTVVPAGVILELRDNKWRCCICVSQFISAYHYLAKNAIKVGGRKFKIVPLNANVLEMWYRLRCLDDKRVKSSPRAKFNKAVVCISITKNFTRLIPRHQFFNVFVTSLFFFFDSIGAITLLRTTIETKWITVERPVNYAFAERFVM
jgi:hypothetical protein